MCLFQIPRQMLYVNLYAIESVSVRDTCENCQFGSRFETELIASRRTYQIKMPQGEHISTHVSAIQQRLAACGRGE